MKLAQTLIIHAQPSEGLKWGNRPRMFSKGKRMTSLLVKYKKACAAGWDDPEGVIQAVAPPGWSEDKMMRLKKHVGTTSAFKLAWWMHQRGKGPGHKK